MHTDTTAAAASGGNTALGGGAFNPASVLVSVDVPELLVLYGCRQALARLLDPHGTGRCVRACVCMCGVEKGSVVDGRRWW
jgi:hypothetical protein